MKSVTATFRNGKLELTEAVDWPEGTRVEVSPIVGRSAAPTDQQESYRDLIRRLAGSFGDEPFERPPQGESELREAW